MKRIACLTRWISLPIIEGTFIVEMTFSIKVCDNDF
uniref:Uncharacterized protein n=1 Tax=Lepeophtheirus salmonis TaxID=72036 RepID=A0A0K2V972_LEPSM